MLSTIRDIVSYLTPAVDAGLGALALAMYVKVREAAHEAKHLANVLVNRIEAQDARLVTVEKIIRENHPLSPRVYA